MKKDYPILILDDDNAILKALQETLSLEGYVCFGTTKAKEAIEYAQKNTIAVVLSDQRMTDMSGTCFLQQIKQIQPMCSRILITGVLESDMFLKAINVAEVFRCLAKPWMREQLLKVIEEAYVFFQEKIANEEAYQALLDSNQKLLEENLQLRSL